MLEIVINCLRLFVFMSFIVTMAMVVMGGMCVQSIMAIRTTISARFFYLFRSLRVLHTVMLTWLVSDGVRVQGR